MTMYKVGEVVPALRGPDGLFLGIDSGGITLTCRMEDPSDEEKASFSAGVLMEITVEEIQGIMVWTVKCGNLPRMDCTFSTMLLPDKMVSLPPLENDAQGYAMLVILADGATGEVKKLRMVSLGHELSMAIHDILQRINGQLILYEDALRYIYSMDTGELYTRAKVRCLVGGDSDG